LADSKTPSERSFGLLFMVLTAVLGVYGLYKGWATQVVGAFFLASLALGLATVFFSWILAPFNKAWFWLGQALGKVVSPIVLGILFYGLITPIALIVRAFGRDEMKLKPRQVESYWVERNPPGPSASSFKNQF